MGYPLKIASFFLWLPIVVGLLFTPFSASAQGFGGFSGIGGPFGGRILEVRFCTCSLGFVLKIGPPRGGDFLYQPGVSRLFAFFRILVPGMWTLGLAGPPAPCLQYRGVACITDAKTPAPPLILIVGTS